MGQRISDYDLWMNLLKGNRHALNKIYNRNLSPLYHYGMRLLQDEDSVRDCLQNVFLKIWTNHKTLRQTDNIRLYLISALRNHIFNLRVEQERFHKVTLEENEMFDLKFSVESEYIRKEEQTEKTRLLTEAMRTLTPRQREIIYLKYFEEMNYDQISEIMGLSNRGAYKLTARALESLREVMNIEKSSVNGNVVSYFQVGY